MRKSSACPCDTALNTVNKQFYSTTCSAIYNMLPLARNYIKPHIWMPVLILNPYISGSVARSYSELPILRTEKHPISGLCCITFKFCPGHDSSIGRSRIPVYSRSDTVISTVKIHSFISGIFPFEIIISDKVHILD